MSPAMDGRCRLLSRGATQGEAVGSAHFVLTQDMLRYGEQLPSIMQAGRWKTAEMGGGATRQSRARVRVPLYGSQNRVQF
jgi:hypothetical protein